MGTILGKVISESGSCQIAGAVDIKDGSYYGSKVVLSKDIRKFLSEKKPDVLVDFTVAHAAVENVKSAADQGIAVVVGTTGFSPEQRNEMKKAIENRVPAVISSNFSVGMNIFWKLTQDAAKHPGPRRTSYRSLQPS
jgi:4-hydroxy-tetrahydrodipicolinate reductase